MSNYSIDQQLPESVKAKIKTGLTTITDGISTIEPRISALQSAIRNDNYTNLPEEIKNIKNKIQAAHKLYNEENNMNYLKSAKIAYDKLEDAYSKKETALKAQHDSALKTKQLNIEQSEETKKAAENAQKAAENASLVAQQATKNVQEQFKAAKLSYEKAIKDKEKSIKGLTSQLDDSKTELITLSSQRDTAKTNLDAAVVQHTAALAEKDAEMQTELISIQNNLSILIGSLSSETILGKQVVENQKKVSSYLDKEQTRITNEKNRMEEDVDHIKREAILSDTRKKRTMAYNYILVVFVLTMTIALVLHYLKKSIIFLPSFLFSFLIVLTLSGGLIYMVNLYLDIIKRDPIYYDKLVFSPPTDPVTAADKVAAAAAAEAQSAALAKLCQTADCCDKVTNAWNADKGLCMPIDKNNEQKEEAFTNIFKSDCCKL